jgi:penicillin-binding protein 1A
MAEKNGSSQSDGERLPEVQPSWRRKTSNRTAAAAGDLLRALRADFGAFRRRLATRSRRKREHPSAKATAAPSRKRYVTRFAASLAVIALAGMLGIAGVMFWALSGIPFDRSAKASPPDRTVILEASDGTPLGRIGSLTSTGQSLEDYPQHLVEAVIAIEDRRFRQHFGIDPIGIARALRRNIAAGGIVEGGSTITQQLVRVQYLDRERSYTRKLREAATAIWLETQLSKEEILTRYLNRVYLGAGAYGMPAAARLYFDKEPLELTLQEAALLAGLIQAPSRYNPLQNLSLAQERARQVIESMTHAGFITADRAREAKANPPSLDRPTVASPAGTWFADWVGQEALKLIGSLEDGVRVRTTLIPEYQRIAEQIVKEAIADNGDRGVTQGALVAMKPDGAVVAMVGGGDYDNSQFNRAVQAKRQPGSAFKLFVYMAALRNGYRLQDTVDTSAPEIDGWRPSNFGDKSYGSTSLAEAFAQSINTASVNLAVETGLESVVDAAHDLGIEAELQQVPSIALGSEELSLLSLTAAYAGVLSETAPVEPWGVAAFSPRDQGRYMSVSPPASSADTLGPVRAKIIELLQLPVQQGTARAAALDGFAAGKTGTSQEYRDAWFIGFNESLVVGIWVGNDESEPMDGVTGGSIPAAMWKAFMTGTGAASEQQSEPMGPTVSAEDDPSPLAREAEQPRPEPVAQSRANLEEKTSARAEEPQTQDLNPAPRTLLPAKVDSHPTGPDNLAKQTRCDIRACSSAYRSFDPSDCTYQPFGGGPRVHCGRDPAGRPDEVRPSPGPQVAADVPSGMCNINLCAETYSSFRASDCTYQPYGGGPRQTCDR